MQLHHALRNRESETRSTLLPAIRMDKGIEEVGRPRSGKPGPIDFGAELETCSAIGQRYSQSVIAQMV